MVFGEDGSWSRPRRGRESDAALTLPAFKSTLLFICYSCLLSIMALTFQFIIMTCSQFLQTLLYSFLICQHDCCWQPFVGQYWAQHRLLTQLLKKERKQSLAKKKTEKWRPRGGWRNSVSSSCSVSVNQQPVNQQRVTVNQQPPAVEVDSKWSGFHLLFKSGGTLSSSSWRSSCCLK